MPNFILHTHLPKLLLPLTTMLVLLCANGYAQYYPSAKRIDPAYETALLQQLKQAKTALTQIGLYLDLANIYFNKPLKRNVDLDHAKQLAEKASKLSALHQNEKSFNDAQLLIADIFAAKRDLLSAEKRLNKLNDTARINLLLNLAYNYTIIENDIKDKDWKKALGFAEQAKALSIELKQTDKELIAARQIATVHSIRGDAGAGQELMDVLNRSRQLGYPFLHYVHNALTNHHIIHGNPDMATYHSLETIKSMTATGDTLAAGDFYIYHAYVCHNDDDYEKGLYYANLAIECYKVHPGRYGLFNPYVVHMKARELIDLNRASEAFIYFKEMMRLYPPESIESRISWLLKMAHFYREFKDFNNSEKYFLTAVTLSRKNKILRLPAYHGIAQLYVETGRALEAKPYLYKMLHFTQSNTPMATQRHFQILLFLADSASGNYFSAMNRQTRFRTLDNLSLRQAKDRVTRELNIKFETERKESELKIKDQNIQLLRQNARIQEIRLNHTRLIRNLTFAGTGLLFLLLFILYRQYRNKQKNNRIILGQNNLITKTNAQLSQLVTEKEILLKEVHHRVKNNLQIMMSLLESQSAYLKNDALRAVEASQHRVYAMSLIHQKLYQLDDISTLNMAIYLREFIHYLSESFDVSGRIVFHFDIAPVELRLTHAIPLALIINEAVTNSIKYAFPEKRNGEIFISLRQTGDDIQMEVADNGIGIPVAIQYGSRNSFGLDLINGLTKEIKGQIYFDTLAGTKITMRFKYRTININKDQIFHVEN